MTVPPRIRSRSVIAAVLVAGTVHIAALPALAHAQMAPDTIPFHDPDLPLPGRIADLIGRMSLEEKVGQLQSTAPAIPRLGVPAYNYRNEALHGLVGPGTSTVFPQSIAIAATWNDALMLRIAGVISDEARAKYRAMVESGPDAPLSTLSFFSPTVNIFRDPRWGRGQEGYGEDPFLTSRMGVAFVRGMQGDDQIYFKTIATAKHFAVHSGPDRIRERFQAQVGAYDLTDTYLPHFEAMVREASVQSAMAAYSGVNGEPISASRTFLDGYLRKRWGFTGFVVSDCGGVGLLKDGHQVVKTYAEAAALALKAGLDLDCGTTYKSLTDAVGQGLVTEAQVDTALGRVLAARFRLGMFDPQDRVPYAHIPTTAVETPEHRALALEAARAAMTLLKNAPVRGRPLLPLTLARGRTLAVIGPMAAEGRVLYGVYSGKAAADVSLLDGIRRRAEGAGLTVRAVAGTDIEGKDTTQIAEAVETARQADVVVMAVGTPASPTEGRDHSTIDLPPAQQQLIERVVATGKSVVVVLVTGSAVAMPWATERVPAILLAWYPGQEGGTAVAETLFGDNNPAGRLPVTFYASLSDLPPYESYDMRQAPGRTYKYFTGTPLYPFGYGLSYTTFRYAALGLPATAVKPGDSVHVAVDVTNTGTRAGDAVVEVYVTKTIPVDPRLNGRPTRPIRALAGFKRVPLKAGEKQRVTVTLPPVALASITEDGKRLVEAGTFAIVVGGAQPNAKHQYASNAAGVVGQIRVAGATAELP